MRHHGASGSRARGMAVSISDGGEVAMPRTGAHSPLPAHHPRRPCRRTPAPVAQGRGLGRPWALPGVVQVHEPATRFGAAPTPRMLAVLHGGAGATDGVRGCGRGETGNARWGVGVWDREHGARMARPSLAYVDGYRGEDDGGANGRGWQGAGREWRRVERWGRGGDGDAGEIIGGQVGRGRAAGASAGATSGRGRGEAVDALVRSL
jgi:hypothetical protein